MTFAEFERLPDTPGKHELIRGRHVHTPPRPIQETALMKRVYALLLQGLSEDRVWPDSTGYRVAGGWIVPDVSITWPDQPQDEKYILRSPMVAVEILSPNEDIETKLTLYFEEGAAEVWVIDGPRKTMSVYCKAGADGPVTRTTVHEEHRCEAAGITVRLDELFSRS